MSWGAARPWPRMEDLGNMPYAPTSGGYSYPTLQSIQGGGIPGAQTPFAANGAGGIPYGAGGGWAPPPPVAAAEASSPWSGLGGLRGLGNNTTLNLGPSVGGKIGGAINGTGGLMLYGLGSDLGGATGRDVNNPLGRTLSSTLKGMGGGLAAGGPVLGIGGGLTNAAGQAGYERGKGNISGGPANAAFTVAESAPGPLGSLMKAGEALGGLSKITGQDWIKPGAVGDKIASLFGQGGGDEKSAEAAATTDTSSTDMSAKLREATTPTALASTAARLGISGDYVHALVADYDQKVQYGAIQRDAGVTTTVPATNDKGEIVDVKGKVVDAPAVDPTTGVPNYATTQRLLTDDEIRQSAYGEFLDALPAIVQQQSQDQSAAQQAASMQAAIAQYMPQVAAPGTAALNSIGTQLLGSIPGLSPGMQQAATNYATTSLNASDAYNTALTNSLAFLPQQMTQQAQQQSADSYQKSYQSQLQQATIMKQLQAEHPELFPVKAAASGSSDPLASLLGG